MANCSSAAVLCLILVQIIHFCGATCTNGDESSDCYIVTHTHSFEKSGSSSEEHHSEESGSNGNYYYYYSHSSSSNQSYYYSHHYSHKTYTYLPYGVTTTIVQSYHSSDQAAPPPDQPDLPEIAAPPSFPAAEDIYLEEPRQTVERPDEPVVEPRPSPEPAISPEPLIVPCGNGAAINLASPDDSEREVYFVGCQPVVLQAPPVQVELPQPDPSPVYVHADPAPPPKTDVIAPPAPAKSFKESSSKATGKKVKRLIGDGNVTALADFVTGSEDVYGLTLGFTFDAGEKEEEIKQSAMRSNDKDVVALKALASAALDPEAKLRVIEIMVLAATSRDGYHFTEHRALVERLLTIFENDELLQLIVESDPESYYRRRLTCAGCTPVNSYICAHCWPGKICEAYFWCSADGSDEIAQKESSDVALESTEEPSAVATKGTDGDGNPDDTKEDTKSDGKSKTKKKGKKKGKSRRNRKSKGRKKSKRKNRNNKSPSDLAS